MAGFRNLRELTDAQDEGRYLYASWRKQPTQTTAAGIWFDLSMSPGNPSPNYYIGSPNTFTLLKQSTDGGLRHGGNVNTLGRKKFLRKMMAQQVLGTGSPLPCKLMDYIGFYPFIDESILDEQFMDNTVSPTRYADGKGVQLMPVVVAGQTGDQTFTVKYTNQDGITDRITEQARMTTQFVNGTVLHSIQASSTYVNNGPFLTLQKGDSGVRSVQSVTIEGVGDVGLFSLVLVKPLASFSLFTVDSPTEVDYWQDMASMPEILDDAYLNLVALPNGTLSGAPINGILETVFN
jgi:hypothetical protein